MSAPKQHNLGGMQRTTCDT